MTRNPPLLSIVIPVGPGERAYRRLMCCLAESSDAFEIILSTCEPLAAVGEKSPGIEWIEVTGPPGRAAQLNRGIRAASARCLWLVHADNRPNRANMEAAADFARGMTRPVQLMTLGWYPLAFTRGGSGLTVLNALGANLRSRLLRMPFGDQAWLISRELFERTGGFDEEFGRGEDLDFIVRARRAGARLRRLEPAIRSSPRRYREQGWLRTTLAHLWLTLVLWFRSIRNARKKRP